MQPVIKAFQAAIEDLTELLGTLDEKQLNRVPFSQSWTAGQVGDHLLKSYGSRVIFNGPTSIANRPVDEKCQPLSTLFLNFDIKLKAEPSDFNYPTDDYIKKDVLLTGIRTTADSIIDFSNKKELGLLCLDQEFPTFGHLTRLEWLHFYTVHTQRHIHQFQNIINHLS